MLPAAKKLIASPEHNIVIGQTDAEDTGKRNA
jgi:hypothetical protein